jgi:chemotaxis protein CheD
MTPHSAITAITARSSAGGAAGHAARLARLKARPRAPGEASFFWFDTSFGREAVKLLPGEHWVDAEDILAMTTLGSCIAACLWDAAAKVGGMNHFMLPEGDGNGRYGSYAMELLVNEMMKRGAARASLEAKVFGGGHVMAGLESLNVGERNTAFVLDWLRAEGIPVISADVLDVYPRKVCFMPATGKALVKRLAPAQGAVLAEAERAVRRAVPAGSVDLF